MKRRYVVLFACLFWGCAMEPDTNPYDYCSAGDYQNCNPLDAGDWIDGNGCDYPVDSTRDVYLGRIGEGVLDAQGNVRLGGLNLAGGAGQTGNDGYVGEIDSQCHSQGWNKDHANLTGGDIDFIRIEVAPGTPVQVVGLRAFNSAMSPVLYFYDAEGNELVTGRADDGGAAYLDVIAPSNPFYVSIEELNNNKQMRKLVCDSTRLTGGYKYRYVLKVKDLLESAITNSMALLTYQKDLKIGKSAEKVHFEHSGQVHYVNFDFDITETGACNFLVRLNYTAPHGAEPKLSPIRKVVNDDGSIGHRWDVSDVYSEVQQAFRIRYDDGMQDASNVNLYHYWFAIYDYNWKYGYDLDYEIYLENDGICKVSTAE